VRWWGRRNLEAARVSQLWCAEIVTRGISSYFVYFVEHGGARKVLIADLPDPAEALFIEQVLERAMHIHDRQMEGELPKPIGMIPPRD
jgi:hypothetical protein